MKCQMLVRTLNAHRHEQDDASIFTRHWLQQSVLATGYNNPCSPLATTICAHHCLQQSALTRTCKLQPHTANKSWFWPKCVLCNGHLCITSRSVYFRETVYAYIHSVWSVPFPERKYCICSMEFQRLIFVTQRASFNQFRHLSGSDSHKLIALYTEHSHWQQIHEACRVYDPSLRTFFYYFQSWVKVVSLM